MSFNPISIDGEVDTLNIPIAGTDPNDANTANNRSGLLHSSMGPKAAARRCRQRYYFDVQWRVPFPEQPAAPLLYYPTTYTELLTKPAAVGVMQSELDAMGDGVLQRIPLSYYPLRPGAVQEARAAAQATEQRTAELQRQARASGQLDRLTWNADDVNPNLHPDDLKLLDTDLDSSLVLQRDLPSLTLLQRPLYTDMGLVPAEERHSARMARIVPQELRNVTQTQQGGAAMLPGSPLAPGSPQGGPGAASAFEQNDEKSWRDGVRRSFQRVRTLDEQFARFLEELTHGKLGLNRADPAHVTIARELWSVLLEGTTKTQQRDAWHALCRFSCNYGDKPHADALREFTVALTDMRLPNFSSAWRPLIRQFADALEKYVAQLTGGLAERKGHLQFSGHELDVFYTGSFQPKLEAEPLVTRQGTELGENHMPLSIYPVEVIPVFPSGFQKAATLGIRPSSTETGELDFLGEAAEDLHHVVLPGGVVTAAQLGNPHVFVGGTNLLLADAPSDMAEGVAISYHATRDNTFESLYCDDANTSSYVLRLFDGNTTDSSSSSGGPSPADLVGATSKDGHYFTFDRIGWQEVCAKAPNMEMPRISRHVLVYSDAAVEEEADGNGKRPREENDGGAAADQHAARRVKEEPASF